MKVNKQKQTRTILILLLLAVTLAASGTAYAQDSFTTGFFSYVIPDGFSPENDLSREAQFFSSSHSDAVLHVRSERLDHTAPIMQCKTVEDLITFTKDQIGLPNIDKINVLKGTETISYSCSGEMSIDNGLTYHGHVLWARKEDQALMAMLTSTDQDYAKASFDSFVNSISVSDQADWTPVVSQREQEDMYVNGRYYLSAASAYVEIDDQQAVVIARNPPENKQTLASALGYTKAHMRQELTEHGADLIIYPIEYANMYIDFEAEPDAYPMYLTATAADWNSGLSGDPNESVYTSNHAAYYNYRTNINYGYLSMYQTVVNGNQLIIKACSPSPFTAEMNAYVENYIDHISFD